MFFCVRRRTYMSVLSIMFFLYLFYVSFFILIVPGDYEVSYSITRCEGAIFPKIETGAGCGIPPLFFIILKIILFPLSPFGISDEFIKRILEVVFNLFTIYVIYLFLDREKVKYELKLVILSLVMFNPFSLTLFREGVDSLAVLFSTLSFYYLYKYLKLSTYRLHHYLKYNKNKLFYLAVFFSFLVPLVKWNGLVTCFLVFLIFIVAIYINWSNKKQRKRHLMNIFIFIFLFLLIVPLFGGYLLKYVRYGNPLIMQTQLKTFQSLFSEETYKTHLNINLFKELFLQAVYGEWREKYVPINFFLHTILFYLSLVLLIIFIIALIDNLKKFLFSLLNNDIKYLLSYDWIFTLIVMGNFLFIIILVFSYNSTVRANPRYIYLGIIAFAKVFLDGLKSITKQIGRRVIIKRGLFSLFFFFLILFLLPSLSYFNHNLKITTCNYFESESDKFLCYSALEPSVLDLFSKTKLNHSLLLVKENYRECNSLQNIELKEDCYFFHVLEDISTYNASEIIEKCDSFSKRYRLKCYDNIDMNIFKESSIDSKKILDLLYLQCISGDSTPKGMGKIDCFGVFALNNTWPDKEVCNMHMCKGWPLGLNILQEMPERVFVCNRMIEPFRGECFDSLFQGFIFYNYVNVSLSEAYDYCGLATGEYKNKCYDSLVIFSNYIHINNPEEVSKIWFATWCLQSSIYISSQQCFESFFLYNYSNYMNNFVVECSKLRGESAEHCFDSYYSYKEITYDEIYNLTSNCKIHNASDICYTVSENYFEQLKNKKLD